MVDLAPFRGQRYDPDLVPDLARVSAPPYDAIDAEEQERLHAASPYNVVRLELGQQHTEDRPGADRYSRAADHHARWTADGTLRTDEAPAFYVYEQRYEHRGEQRVQIGLLGALQLTPWEDGLVLPHERIFRGPVEDRKRLLAALPVNVSPVFVLIPGTPPPLAVLLSATTARPPEREFRDAEGAGHRLWSLADAAVHAVVRAELEGQHVLMADGHHRYTTALEHHRERPGPGTDRILAYVAGADRGPVIDASHRLVRRLPTDTVSRLRAAGFTITPAHGSAEALARRLEGRQDRFALVTADRSYVVRGEETTTARLVAEVEAPVNGLAVTKVQQLLFGPLEVADRIEDLRYTSDVAWAAREVDRGEADGLFLVPPVPFETFRAACEAGVRMPPKSTSFRPKPRTGLILRPLDPPPPE